MDLAPRCKIGPAQVEAICKIDDHSYRNRWIVYAYHDLSDNLRKILGDNANFATFATWSSRVIGEQIRTDVRNKLIVAFREAFPEPLKWIPRPLYPLQKAWRERAGSSVGQVMGYGNRMIFHEIAYELSRFVEAYGEGGHNPKWKDYVREINELPATELFPAAQISRFREGMYCYYRARSERDEKRQAELVLQGTILISSYEQARVDFVLRAALSLFPRRLLRVGDEQLLRVSGCGGFVDVQLRRSDRPWQVRHRSLWRRGLAQIYARQLTHSIMNVEIPTVPDLDAVSAAEGFEELRLGRGVNLKNGSLYLDSLAELHDPNTAAVFAAFDRSEGKAELCRAHNWTHFDERMNFIANYFRARQRDRILFTALPREYRIVRDMDVSDANLDHLRTIGDDEADELAIAVAEHTGLRGRELIGPLAQFRLNSKESMKEQFPAEVVEKWYGESTKLPDWACEKKLRDGQKFFQLFRLEIASALFNAALPKTYTAADGARVLTETADQLARGNKAISNDDAATLVGDVQRRIAETGQMLQDVMGTDDGDQKPFAPGTHAYQAVLGVRLFHAAVRHQLLHGDTEWPVAELGVPINQEDLFGVLTAFSVAVIDAMDDMGVQFSQDDRIAYLHTWLVIGHLMGIEYKGIFPHGLNAESGEPPLDYEELRVVLYRVFTRHGRYSVDGVRLQRALLDVQRARMPWPFKGLPAASIRYFLGDRAGDDLGVPPADPTRHLLKLMGPFNVLRTLPYHVDWLGSFIRRRSNRLYNRYIEQARGNLPDWRRSTPTAESAGEPRAVSTSTV